ncbi:MAG TPA: hypothetical protein VEI82_02545, partial [Myxococcota bacterium]|nr:hypothetical protein [Myxococcota bacterium]
MTGIPAEQGEAMNKVTRSHRLLAGAVALAAFAAIALAQSGARAEIAKPFWTDGDSSDASGRPDSFADLAEKVSPAVVNIKVERKTSLKGG